MKKNLAIIPTLILLSLLGIAAVSAADIEFKIEPIRNEISSTETAQFLVTITNNLNTIKEFRIFSPHVEWSMPTETIKAYPGTIEYKLLMAPSKYVVPDRYGVRLDFKDTSTGETVYSEIVQVNLLGGVKAVSSYRASVRITADLPTSIDPGKPATFRVKLENQNLLNLSDLTLRVVSEISGFETEQQVKLIPLGKKIVELNYNLDPLLAPGDYRIAFELVQEGEVVERLAKTVTIATATPPFDVQESESGFFFKSRIAKTFTSKANVADTQSVKIPTTFFKNIFTSTNIDSETIKEDGKRFISVVLTLEPGESKEVIVTVNYRPVVYLILLGLVALFVYYRYRSPLKLKKGVSDVNVKEGGISELKVTLELTSAAKTPISNAVITDYIPNIAEIGREFGEGTLKPTKMFKHKKKGTILKWEVNDIAPGEDRLISYTIKSRLSIVGDFKLPRAKVSFKQKGRAITGYSNSVGVSS